MTRRGHHAPARTPRIVPVATNQPGPNSISQLARPQQGVLATACTDMEGIALHGSRADLSSLAGWVAGEANHARRGTRRSELLDSLAEQLEDVLVTYGR